MSRLGSSVPGPACGRGGTVAPPGRRGAAHTPPRRVTGLTRRAAPCASVCYSGANATQTAEGASPVTGTVTGTVSRRSRSGGGAGRPGGGLSLGLSVGLFVRPLLFVFPSVFHPSVGCFFHVCNPTWDSSLIPTLTGGGLITSKSSPVPLLPGMPPSLAN